MMVAKQNEQHGLHDVITKVVDMQLRTLIRLYVRIGTYGWESGMLRYQ